MIRNLTAILVLLLFATATARAQFPHERVYNIETVTVTAKKGEDRAYRIMRNAIARAPYHANQVSEYSAEVYLKGSFDVVKISRVMRGMAGQGLKNVKEGENYMQESWNEIEFTAPGKYEQRVIKQLSSMPDVGEGGGDVAENAMRLVNINIYDIGALGGLIISPLSPGAFSHYRFRYEGYTEVAGRIINKIRITPMRRSQQLVSGHIFIAEDYWNVHGLDISGSMNIVVGIDFNLQTDYGEVKENVWMPTSHRITFDMGLAGSRAKMRYVSSVDYKRIVENTSLRAPAPTTAPAPGVPQKKVTNREAYRAARQATKEIEAPRRESLDLTEEFADNFKVTVDTTALAPDPEFWDRVRPIALEPAELEGYRNRGVAATTAPDTTSTRRGSSIFLKVLTGGGKPLRLGEKGGEFVWHGIMPSRDGFNTVDGYYFGLAPVSWRKTFGVGAAGTGTPKAILTIKPEAIWAINRHVFMGELTSGLKFAPSRRGEFNLGVGSVSRDFNGGGGGILPLENTVASLFFRRNYLKLYQDNFVEAAGSIDPVNGLTLSAGAKYSHRSGLENTSDYSFFYRDSRAYTPNFVLEDHTAAIFNVGLSYTPRLYYRIGSDGRRQPVRSSWPTFFAEWQKGVKGLWGSSTDFDHIGGGLRQNISPGPGQLLRYYVRGGAFVNKRSLHFPDFRHFAGGDIPLQNRSIMSGPEFRLLPYYRYSTGDSYIQAHVSYQARFILLKLLPWFSNRLWMEGLQLNYLTTPTLRNYTELGYTIGLFLQAGVFVGFEGLKYRSVGVKLSLPIRINNR